MSITIYELGRDIGIAAEELNSCVLCLNEAMAPLGELSSYYEPRNEKTQGQEEQPSGMLGEIGYSVSRLKERLVQFRTQIDAINRMVGVMDTPAAGALTDGPGCAQMGEMTAKQTTLRKG